MGHHLAGPDTPIFGMAFVSFFPTDTRTRTMTCWHRGVISCLSESPWQFGSLEDSSRRLANDRPKSSNVWKLVRYVAMASPSCKLVSGATFLFALISWCNHNWPFLILRLVVWHRQETARLQALWVRSLVVLDVYPPKFGHVSRFCSLSMSCSIIKR